MPHPSDSPVRHVLPDVVSEVRAPVRGALAWVGMEDIEQQIAWRDADGALHRLAARASVHLDLPGDADRGIHMSRLYRLLDEASLAPLTPASLQALLERCLETHAGLSRRARLRLRFEMPLRRASLRSGLGGWRLYPVQVEARLDAQGLRLEARVDVMYSSTCPGSAALARQLVQDAFRDRFPARSVERDEVEEWLGQPGAICATPHAQRSVAAVRVRWDDASNTLPFEALVDTVEAALGTPVQTAVRREDEQEFARLNGANPMYCEDAVRRVRAALERDPAISDYAIRAAHLESLHPHDAVAYAARGVENGLDPDWI